jgi:PEGA domain
MRALLVMFLATAALANENPTHEAGRHFQRGVDLYNDGDFRGALVEFKKAYDTWPRANVLYDIGQTQFQLMDYAGALTTMNRYLAETGPTAAHRAEVEGTVEVLRGRVGRVLVTTEVVGCDVTVDDQAQGTTPVQQAILVSIGLRRVTVSCAGRPAISRTVEVSAGERVEVELKVPPPLVARVASPSAAKVEGPPSKAGMAAGWTTTGLLLVGTVAVGSSALVQESHLQSLRNSYPTTRAALDKQANLVQSLSIAADVIGAATLVAAAVSTWATVKYRKEGSRRRVAWSPTGVTF